MLIRDARIFWDVDPKARCLEFCDQLDFAYYDEMASILVETINASEDNSRIRRLDTALRFQYLHAQETLFTSLLALMQAPLAVAPYFTLLKTAPLLAAVKQISEQKFAGGISIPTLTDPSWSELSRLVHMGVRSGDGWSRTTAQFADFWATEALFYASDLRTKEYNALKHCGRVASQAFGLQLFAGDSKSPERWIEKAEGGQGSQFTALETIEVDRQEAKGKHVAISHQAVNWDRQTVACRLQLLSCSIGNVVATLKSMNGATERPKWRRPENEAVFEKAQKSQEGLGDLNIRYPLELPKEHQYGEAKIRKLLQKS